MMYHKYFDLLPIDYNCKLHMLGNYGYISDVNLRVSEL